MIAERDKTFGKILLGMSVLLTGLSVWLLTVSLWYILSLLLGAALLAVAVYLLLLPKTAILKDGDGLVICYAFRQKRIPIGAVEYASCNELGEYRSRRGGAFTLLYIFKNDIRRLTVTVKENGELKHFTVFPVLFASAVSASINAMADKARK